MRVSNVKGSVSLQGSLDTLGLKGTVSEDRFRSPARLCSQPYRVISSPPVAVLKSRVSPTQANSSTLIRMSRRTFLRLDHNIQLNSEEF